MNTWCWEAGEGRGVEGGGEGVEGGMHVCMCCVELC